ncbi:MAG: flagellar hook-basal body complex protein FliE [Candidatus Brocadiaceae bacterium]|nr:flagellar hook-basal body complex protein FliE [Candidatus Brocadiaceae bacterium]
MAVSPIHNTNAIQANKEVVNPLGKHENGPSFKETMGGFIHEINDLQTKANESIESFAMGKVENVHEVMLAMSKAEVSFKFMMETRNKLVETYKEIMRMQM